MTYFAFKVCQPEHFRRIESIQDSIPHMAPMVGPIENIVMLERARGQLLWETELEPDPAIVERQLVEFALGTQMNQLIHGDLRPWNVIINEEEIQVIDWWSVSAFVEDLLPRGELPPLRADLLGDGHYAKFHADLVREEKYTDIDLADARMIGRLLRKEIRLSDSIAWGGHYSSLDRFWPR